VVEELACQERISLRTGCFCNPGAAEVALGLTAEQMRPWFGRAEPVAQEEFRDGIAARCGARPAAIRVSLGVASNFADVYQLTRFLRRFLNRRAIDINAIDVSATEIRGADISRGGIRSLSFGPADQPILAQPARTVA
jgi:molybdenum cofactor sulfurtransferase